MPKAFVEEERDIQLLRELGCPTQRMGSTSLSTGVCCELGDPNEHLI